MSEIKPAVGEAESGQVPQSQILRQRETLGQARLLTLIHQLLHLCVQAQICKTHWKIESSTRKCDCSLSDLNTTEPVQGVRISIKVTPNTAKPSLFRQPADTFHLISRTENVIEKTRILDFFAPIFSFFFGTQRLLVILISIS